MITTESPTVEASRAGSTPTLPNIDFKTLFELTPTPLMLLDRELRFVAANQAYLAVTASRWTELAGRYLFELFPDEPNSSSAETLRRSLRHVVETGQPDTLALISYKVPRLTPAGVVVEERYWSATHTPIFDAAGKVAYVLQNTMEVSELRQFEGGAESSAALTPREQIEAGVLQRARTVQQANRTLESERSHLRRLFEQAPGFVAFLRGERHVFELVNTAYTQLVGHREVLGKPVFEALPEVVEQGFTALLDQVYVSGEPFVGMQQRVLLQRSPQGPLEETFVDFIYQPIIEPDGSISGVFVQGSDVTQQVRAQEELGRYREQLEDLVVARTRALEESQAALRQAQKMESLGQLTGGVAHDFNNILAANITSLELALRKGPAAQVERLIDNALRAARRGAGLVDQLLAFARKQRMEARPLELSALVAALGELLPRTLGPAVELELELAENLWLVRSDAGQFESAVLNLAVNARDAMPQGGRLRIDTSNVAADSAELPTDLAPADYVRVRVTDTGSGMEEAVRAKAFDPFYTTKSPGKGTGLGLSQVYGFAKQSGGTAVIDSRPGAGTSIALYLPRTREVAVPAPELCEPTPKSVPVGARALIVDDDAGVREALAEILRELGLAVLTCDDPQQGLRLLAEGETVDAVLVDYSMPKMTGTEFIRRVAASHPDLPCLLVTGYVGDEAARASIEAANSLRKPFSVAELAAALNRLLAKR